MPVKIQALASGSNGNCFFIGSPEGSILIDAGISYKSLKEKLAAINESENNIKAIFISHAHTDHMKGLPVIIKNLKVPVIASEQTLHHLYRYEEVITGGSNILDYGVFLYSKTIGHIGPFKYTNVMTKHDIE
ncbi:MAG: MBL fold metallo-hydrolase [Candidatus Thorarchaeota archaeon]